MLLKENSIYIGGVRIDNVSMSEVVSLVFDMAKSDSKHLVATPNMDFLYNASRNKSFNYVLNSSSLNIPDGKPLIILSKAQGQPLKEKVSGADFFVEVCKHSVEHNVSIFLMGAAPGVAQKAKENLENKFSGLNIVGTVSPSFGFEKNESESHEIINKINKSSPDILFVGVGSPKQELWIHKYLDQLNVKVAVGVGASFDFAAGHVKIPPPAIKKLGAAWLWRLLMEPKRLWKRYLINNLPLFFKLYFNALWKRHIQRKRS